MVSSAASLAAFARLVVLLLVCGRATPCSSTPAFTSGLGSRRQIHCAARRRFRLASPASAVAPPDAAVQPPPPVILSAAATCGARAEWLHASSAPVLNDTTLAALRERGYAVVENFLSLDEAAALRLDASELEAAGHFLEAGVGHGARRKMAVDIRRSRLCWLFPPPPVVVGRPSERLALKQTVDSIRAALNERLGLDRPLEPFVTEMQYLAYPAGGYYLRHLDTTARNGGWMMQGREENLKRGGLQLRRTVSFLLYLNDASYRPEHGGALRIFECGREEDGPFIDVLPRGGTLVLFRSDAVEHEVLETLRPRFAIAGWFRIASDAADAATSPPSAGAGAVTA